MDFGTIGAGTVGQGTSSPTPVTPKAVRLLFYSGDDDAKEAFREVADSIGFAPTDAGTLREGGRLMQVGGGPLSAVHALRQD
jgi:8-hydroxy-5-deazaflavin:NADPH oxidoreductase